MQWKGRAFSCSSPRRYDMIRMLQVNNGTIVNIRYIQQGGKLQNMDLLLGNEAIARGAYEAGVRVATAYPGTPSTEITEALAATTEIYCEWSPNEKVALEVALGAAMGGARAMCSMKHVGLNVAADPLFTSAYSGICGGLVIIVADDPGMHSSQNEQDSRYYAKSAHVPMLEPSNSAECLAFTKLAFEISEAYDTPVLVRLTTRVAHARSLVELGEVQEVALRDYVKNPAKYVMMPGFARLRHPVVVKREETLRSELSRWNVNKIEHHGDKKVGVVCSGSCYHYVREALPKASVLKLGIAYPLDETLVRKFRDEVESLYIIEELEPFYEEKIRSLGIVVEAGKDRTGPLGELFARKIAHLFADGEEPGPMETGGIPARPPVLCPGCPHRAVFYVLSKLGVTVSGDIGCYTLGALPPLSSMDSEICMGAAVGMALGLEKARGAQFAENTVALLGDSTFIHSGITGLIDMVYNGSNGTVLILDNSTTGMTGHQQNPTTGKNIRCEPAAKVNLEALCESVGVASVRVVDPFDMKAFELAVKEETKRSGVSVIIARRPCALLDKKREKPYLVVESACIRCGICMKIGCPAICLEEKTARIMPELCVGCGQCAGICPKNAIQREEK